MTRIMGTLHEDLYTFIIKCRWILLREREMFQTEVVKKIKTHVFNFFYVFSDRASWYRIISSTNFNAQFSLFINNMFVTLLSSTCFEH